MGGARPGQTWRDSGGGALRPHGRRRGVRGPSRAAGAARESAGTEDKAWTGTGLRGQDALVVEHNEATVEQLAQLDALPGPAAPTGGQGAVAPSGGRAARCVVGGHAAGVAAAEEQRQGRWGTPPRGLRPGWRVCEAAVVVGTERGQEGVGGLRRGDAAQAQFADEPILQGLPQALDAALGLGGAGGDDADPEALVSVSPLSP
jgi:hypothetical protein